MNYIGSYTKLRDNSVSAIIALIEIYNKPTMEYREECVSILAINAWELLFKAILARNKISIYRPKEKTSTYKTLNWFQAFERSKECLPSSLMPEAIYQNLNAICTFRNNVVHFYNKPGFKIIIYSLLQANIMNYKDYIHEVFGINLEDKISWVLLPIGIRPPYNPIEYISNSTEKNDPAIMQFIQELRTSISHLESEKLDTARFFSIYTINLQSIKKVGSADFNVGITNDQSKGPLVLQRQVDPNKSHPFRQKDILIKIGEIKGIKLTQHVFQSICYEYEIKKNILYCWKDDTGMLIKYSSNMVELIKHLSREEIVNAISKYKGKKKR